MTLAPPPDPGQHPRPRRLLGHLTGALTRRREPAPVAGGRVAVATRTDADDDAAWWDLVRGTDRPAPASPPSPAGRGASAAGGGAPVPGDLTGVDGWLTARAGSGAPAERASTGVHPVTGRPVDHPTGTPTGGLTGALTGTLVGPVTAPVRVPAWPAWVASSGSDPDLVPARAPDHVPAPATVEPTGVTTVPSVVRVSSARPAPVRAPVRRTVPVAAPDPAPPAGGAGPVDADGPPAGEATGEPGGPRGTVGTVVELVLADGRRVPLTTTLLVGRHPAPRAGETVGGLVAVDDPARSVSKTHLTVGVDDGGPWVVDRHSTNGTVVTLPDGQRILCVPERRVRLAVGASVHFGEHGFTLAAAADPERPPTPALEDDR